MILCQKNIFHSVMTVIICFFSLLTIFSSSLPTKALALYDDPDEIWSNDETYSYRSRTLENGLVVSIWSASEGRPVLSVHDYIGTSNEVEIPSHVEGFPLMAIDYEAFKGKSITSVTFASDFPDYRDDFENDDFYDYAEGFVVSENAFADCNSLKSIVLPAFVHQIAYNAFQNSGVQEITIMDPDARIDMDVSGDLIGAFRSIDTTNHPSIPKECKIKGYANSTANIYSKRYNYNFESIGNESAITIPEKRVVGGFSFEKNRAGKLIVTGKNVFEFNDDEYEGGSLWNYLDYTSVTGLVLSDGITQIPDYEETEYWGYDSPVFLQFDRISQVSIPETMMSVGNNSFSSMYLEELSFPESVTYIGDNICHGEELKIITVKNSKCKISENMIKNISPETVVYGFEKSTIHNWAKKHNTKFIAIDAEEIQKKKTTRKILLIAFISLIVIVAIIRKVINHLTEQKRIAEERDREAKARARREAERAAKAAEIQRIAGEIEARCQEVDKHNATLERLRSELNNCEHVIEQLRHIISTHDIEINSKHDSVIMNLLKKEAERETLEKRITNYGTFKSKAFSVRIRKEGKDGETHES